ncbi:hypothetical protein FORC47_p440 (plasmid) [Bacillus cereus]|nr:hypothetical protein FORC47_p440 [Bacillus cereus]
MFEKEIYAVVGLGLINGMGKICLDQMMFALANKWLQFYRIH